MLEIVKYKQIQNDHTDIKHCKNLSISTLLSTNIVANILVVLDPIL